MSSLSMYNYSAIRTRVDPESRRPTRELIYDSIAAASIQEAEIRLEERELDLIGIAQESTLQRWLRNIPLPGLAYRVLRLFSRHVQRRVKNYHLQMFFSTLAAYVSQYRTIAALVLIGDDRGIDPVLGSAVRGMAADMEIAGLSLHDAARLRPHVFDAFTVDMLAASAESDLVKTAERLAERYDRIQERGNTFATMLLGPTIFAFFGIVLTYFLMIVLVPVLQQLYKFTDTQLPWFTQLTVTIATSIAQPAQMALGILVAIVLIAIFWALGRTRRGRWFYEMLLLRFGGAFGRYFRADRTSDVAWMLATIHGSGQTWEDGLRVVAPLARSVVLEDEVLTILDEVKEEGALVQDSFKRARWLDPVLADFLQATTVSADPAKACEQAAALLERNVATFRARIRVIAPQVIGVIFYSPIAFVIFSLYAPIYLLLPKLLAPLAHLGGASGVPVVP